LFNFQFFYLIVALQITGVGRTNDENAPFEDVEQENIEHRHYLHG
jgi:hypothetical protein